jgi:mannose/cellobiose epimerase-like protein (N-acyl-D-glucosamine 2-epimerase family)
VRKRVTGCVRRLLQGPAGSVVPLGLWSVYALARRVLRQPAASAPRPALPSGYPGTDGFDARFFARHALERLLPFWRLHAVDTVHGGFDTLLDRRGERFGDGTRYAAMQGRMIHAFCQGHRLDPTGGWLTPVRHGVDYLLAAFADRARGGWFSSVYRDGRVRDLRKHLFHQAFVIVGLAEYACATGNQEALARARETCELLDRHAWDPVHGGYRECCARDWSTLSSEKTACIQLDMLQALLQLHEATGEASLLQRSIQLADLIAGRMVDRHQGLLLETFSRAWRYRPARTGDVLWVGHSLKAARLLLLLSTRLPDPGRDLLARRLVDRCVQAGWDAVRGGFHQYVYRRGCLARAEKLWWTQCEGILALSALAVRGLPYSDLLRRLCAFTFASFHDPDHLEWYTSCRADGSVLDDRKGGVWKTAYHPVQACAGAFRAFHLMEAATAGVTT